MSTEKIVNMKRINIFIIVSLLVVIGHAQETQTERAAFGIAFQGEGSLTQVEMSKKYTTMKISDTVQTGCGQRSLPGQRLLDESGFG